MIYEELFNSLKKETDTIQSFMEQIYDKDNPQVISERMVYVSSYLARSGVLLADTKHLLTKEKHAIYDVMKDELLSMKPTEATRTVSFKTADIDRLLLHVDSISRALVHQMDALRSQLSYCKEDMLRTKGV